MNCDEYIRKIPAENQSKLDDMIEIIHCARVATVIVHWELLAPLLQLHRGTVRDIAHTHKDSLQHQG